MNFQRIDDRNGNILHEYGQTDYIAFFTSQKRVRIVSTLNYSFHKDNIYNDFKNQNCFRYLGKLAIYFNDYPFLWPKCCEFLNSEYN